MFKAKRIFQSVKKIPLNISSAVKMLSFFPSLLIIWEPYGYGIFSLTFFFLKNEVFL